MGARGSLDVPVSATLNFWVSLVKVHLGKGVPRSSLDLVDLNLLLQRGLQGESKKGRLHCRLEKDPYAQ